ncbi:MAG TPA: ABC transporter permease [Candidatus Acidoferrales bacterium]|nr:ABC transporter permease [Candidatus Acidoferrales bacterium]
MDYIRDFRYAGRVLLKNLGATSIMVFTLALAIGATTAIFSVVYGVLLRPLPYPHSDRIMAIWEVNNRGTYSRLADPNFDDFRDQNHTLQSMAKYEAYITAVAGASEPTRTGIALVTKDFFNVLRVSPAMGRDFSSDDAHTGAAPVSIVSYGYWRQYLGSARDLSQFKLRIEGRVYSIVGVMPSAFQFPEATDVWVPAELDAENKSRTSHNFYGIGRLRDGVTVPQANVDISNIARNIVSASTEKNNYLLKDAAALPLQASLTGTVNSPLYILLGAVFFLLLVACANVANLLLSQAAARGRELAVRNALGAGRGRLIRQFITESCLLALMSCVAGILVALWGVSGLIALAPTNLPRLESISMSWPVLAFAAGVSLLVAVGLGIFTAVRATGGGLRESLLEGGRGQAGSQSSQRVGRVIVVAQLAITLVLLVGAGLLGRSLLRVLSVDPGFRTDNIVTMDISVPSSDDPTAKAHLSQLYTSLFDRLHAVPGVQETGVASDVPLDEGLPDGMFVLMSQQELPKKVEDFSKYWGMKERQGEADFCSASPGYFQALGIPLVRGRMFDDRDGFNSPQVALISQSLATSRWPNQDPLGQTVEFGNMDGDLHLLTIVGVVGDTREYGLEKPPVPTLYVNALQRPRFASTVVIRATSDSRSVTTAARSILRDVAPDVAPRFRTFSSIYSASLGSRNFNLTLVGVFAGTALLLAVAGIYGVMAYSVTQRTREFGVRIALGASSGNVLGMVLSQGLRTALIGVVIGVAGALVLTRTIQSLLFGVTSTDPVTFSGVALLLVGVAALACYIPARRATRVDPMEALRHE